MRATLILLLVATMACMALAIPTNHASLSRHTNLAPRGYEDDDLPRGWWKVVLITIAIQTGAFFVIYILFLCCASCCACSVCCMTKEDRRRERDDARESAHVRYMQVRVRFVSPYGHLDHLLGRDLSGGRVGTVRG
jgi:hypothetical protein